MQAAYRAGEDAPAPRGLGGETAAPQAAAVPGRGAEAVAPLHPATLPLVQQQLELQATDVFRWSGQAWPGVPMDWSIEEQRAQPDAQAEAAEAPPRRWRTTVTLTLPTLGRVELDLQLSEQQVQARLAAAEPATQARLAADGEALAHRLAGAGLRLQDLQIAGMPAP